MSPLITLILLGPPKQIHSQETEMCAYDYPHIALIISYPIVLPYIDTLIFERAEGKDRNMK